MGEAWGTCEDGHDKKERQNEVLPLLHTIRDDGCVQLSGSASIGCHASPSSWVGVTMGPEWTFRSGPRPEITAANFGAPTIAGTGGTITATWRTTNVGGLATASPWTERLYLSTDTEVGGDVLLATITEHGTLAAGAGLDRSLDITLTGTVPGDYYLLLTVDTSTTFIKDFQFDLTGYRTSGRWQEQGQDHDQPVPAPCKAPRKQQQQAAETGQHDLPGLRRAEQARMLL